MPFLLIGFEDHECERLTPELYTVCADLKGSMVQWRDPQAIGAYVRDNSTFQEDATRLHPEELEQLAQQLAEASDPVEAARLKERLMRGFYGQPPRREPRP